MKGLENEIAGFIATHILPGSSTDHILASTSLFEDGFVDSLGLQQILIHVEDEYDIEVDEDDLIPENFATVGGIAGLVMKRKAA